jgi:hypothetical protein
MGRYQVNLRDGSHVGADDARITGNGQFVEFITRYSHETVVVPRESVSSVQTSASGWEGGQRFTGSHDSSFSKTPGSI